MKRLTFFIILTVFFASCSSPLDFEQANQLVINPVFESDILYFDLHKPNLTDQSGNFRSTIKDTVDFVIFDDAKVRNGFVKAEIEVAYKNSFTRQFTTALYFIDEQNQTVEEDYFNIDAATNSQPEILGDTIFFFDKLINPQFINSKKIVIEVNITPNTLPIEDKQLHVQVKGIFYTEITIE